MINEIKESMKLCIKEKLFFSEYVNMYGDCNDSSEVMHRMKEALEFYTGEDAFENGGYMYEIHENALPRMVELTISKLISKFELDEEEAWLCVVDLYSGSSALNE